MLQYVSRRLQTATRRPRRLTTYEAVYLSCNVLRWRHGCRRWRRAAQRQFRPARLEELTHEVTGLADLRVVLVEQFAVGEDEPNVGRELVVSLVTVEQSATRFPSVF